MRRLLAPLQGLNSVAVTLPIWLLTGCAASSASTYGPAAAGAGILLATTAVHRGITGDCWARCGRGMVCDRESGLCVEGECTPACPSDQSCQRLSIGLSCVPQSFGKPTANTSARPKPNNGPLALGGAAPN